MNTLKIECSRDDYFIKTAPNANGENELKVEIPEVWNCDYANALLWEDEYCEILEGNDGHRLIIPNCGELLLETVKVDSDDNKSISVPLRYEGQELLILKV